MARGQITVFIIIGIVLLAGFGLITYFVNFSVEETLQAEALPVMDKVSQEFEPVQDFITNCMYDGIASGIKKISTQGGYLYPDLLGTWSQQYYTDTPGIQLGNVYVPFWSHSSIPFDQGMNRVYSIPSLSGSDKFAIDRQLSTYVSEYVEECTENYVVFTQYDIASGNREVTVNIFDDKVDVYLVMPTTIKRGDVTSSMTNFVVQLDTDFKTLYDDAVRITQFQHTYHYFEFILKEVMPIYMGINQDNLPPYSHSDVGNPTFAQWSVFSVTEQMQSILNQYMNMIRYAGNPDLPYKTYDGEYSGVMVQTYDKMIFPQQNGNHYVKFDYFNFEPALRLNNGAEETSGKTIASSDPTEYGTFNLKTTTFETRYDISWPMLVSLDSEEGLAGQPLTFMFALEGLIHDNHPAYGTYTHAQSSPSEDFQLLCDERQHTEHHNVTVVDYKTRQPITADVSYTIDGAGTCYVGETSDGKLSFTSSKSYGAMITVEADGYLTQNYFFNLVQGENLGYLLSGTQGYVLPVYPEHTLDINLTFNPLSKCIDYRDVVDCKERSGRDNTEDCLAIPLGTLCGDTGSQIFSTNPIHTISTVDSNAMNIKYAIGSSRESLDNDTQIAVIMKRVSHEFGDNPFLSSEKFQIMLTGNEAGVSIYPGIYETQVLLVRQFDPPFVFQNETRCSGTKNKNCIVFETFEVDSIPQAIYSFNATITSDDLYSASTMELPLVGINIPESHLYNMGDEFDVPLLISEEFAFVSDLTPYLQYSQNALQPRWSYE